MGGGEKWFSGEVEKKWVAGVVVVSERRSRRWRRRVVEEVVVAENEVLYLAIAMMLEIWRKFGGLVDV